MNEEIEYAEMLEIPISTVNVINRRYREGRTERLEETLIEKINEQTDPPEIIEESPSLEAEYDVQADTAEDKDEQKFSTTLVEDDDLDVKWKKRRGRFLRELFKSNRENGVERTDSKRGKLVYRIEFAAACVLCLGIFLTNVFMPNSAINTFFRSMTEPQAQADERVFSDFDLNSIVGTRSTAALSVSPEGVVTFTAEGCVYPAVDGTVTDVLATGEGGYVVKIEHSPSFSSVFEGVDHVYYQVGDKVKHNVPVAYSYGERAVQMTMYADGELLDCLQIDGENCLVWAEN